MIEIAEQEQSTLFYNAQLLEKNEFNVGILFRSNFAFNDINYKYNDVHD